MEIKIETLNGIALDWAVAVVLGITTGKVVRIDGNNLICEGILPLGVVSCDDGTFDICINKLKYSSKWDVAGPFITKYKIDIEHFDDGVVASIPIEKENDSWMFSCSGSTELEAAMKCLVSKFVGEYDMDVPNEIIERFLK